MLLANPASENDKGHEVTLAFGAGASATVAEAFTQRFGIPLREVYGMTEAASFTTINVDGPAGSIGQPLAYFQLSLRDENDALVSVGEVGEMALSCPSVPLLTPGYFRNSSATNAAFRDQRFYTGDLARQDDYGNLYFCGRLKDRLRCKGENVMASDVEAVFNAHPLVAESAVAGVGTQLVEQELVVFLLLSVNNDTVNEFDVLREVVHWTDTQLAPYQQPRYVMVVQGFARTPSERIQKHKLPIDEISARAWDRRAKTDD
jgi:crotonobetaine/carnitine-CoA ligase